MSEYVRIAAIDIGSDTVHLLIADVTASSDGPLVSDIEQLGELIELGGGSQRWDRSASVQRRDSRRA